MRKLIAFFIWWGSAIGAIALLITHYTNAYEGNEPGLIRLIFGALLFLLSGIGRRIFHIKPQAIENAGLWYCIGKRVHCRRFYISIFQYASLSGIMYAVGELASNAKGTRWLVVGIVSVLVFLITRGMMQYSCSHCGNGLVMDDREYDDNLIIEHTSSSSTASRYSTDYYHCPRCGKRSYIRVKHTAAKVNYR